MLIPKRVKFRRQHRPHRSGVSKGGNRVTFGDYGLQALEPTYITNRPLTQKPLGVRMGSGKGPVEKWVANVKPGRILFEMSYPNEEIALEALRRAGNKLPCKVRIVKKEDQF
ncbi:MAG: large ribosomal subunit protein uL16 [Corynebacterium variabile]|uniref:large ribosomal subunit protein uL16 n=1 Tax=Corynebacterium variabile TaxID=1727 RepID=UPI003F91FEDE